MGAQSPYGKDIQMEHFYHTVTVITYIRVVTLKGLLCVIVIINHSKFP